MQPDKETQKILTRGEKLKLMTESEGWAIARAMLIKKASQQLNMMDLNSLDPHTVINVIGIRQETAKALVEWLKEVENDVEQHKSNSGALDNINPDYILELK